MVAGVMLEPDAVYDDGTLQLMLGVTPAALARARREGTLRSTRKGRRTLYLGRWVVDWLDGTNVQNNRDKTVACPDDAGIARL